VQSKNKIFISEALTKKRKEQDKETILNVPKVAPIIVNIGDILVVGYFGRCPDYRRCSFYKYKKCTCF
jgi:hypothetical protein